jgi:hypothetical protein
LAWSVWVNPTVQEKVLGVVIAAPSTITNPAPEGLEVMVKLTVLGADAKFAVIVPDPLTVADVDAELVLVSVIDPVLLDHEVKV